MQIIHTIMVITVVKHGSYLDFVLSVVLVLLVDVDHADCGCKQGLYQTVLVSHVEDQNVCA